MANGMESGRAHPPRVLPNENCVTDLVLTFLPPREASPLPYLTIQICVSKRGSGVAVDLRDAGRSDWNDVLEVFEFGGVPWRVWGISGPSPGSRG